MRCFWLISGLMLFNGAALAADLTSSLQQCLTLSSDPARLSCYDQLARSVSAASAPALVPVPSPAPMQPMQPKPQSTAEQFGLKQKDPSEILGQISAKVLTVKITPLRKYEVQLDNQQVWRQQDAEKMDIRVGDQCLIRSGSLKSFLMECERRKKSMRVRRVE